MLAKAGFKTREAASAGEGLERLLPRAVRPAAPRSDAAGSAGLELLGEVRARWPEMPVVVVTAYSSVESAIAAMREGAFHYLPKPFRNEEVVHVVKQAL